MIIDEPRIKISKWLQKFRQKFFATPLLDAHPASFAATAVPPIILADQDNSAQAALLATYNTVRAGKFGWVAGVHVRDISVRPVFTDAVGRFNAVLALGDYHAKVLA